MKRIALLESSVNPALFDLAVTIYGKETTSSNELNQFPVLTALIRERNEVFNSFRKEGCVSIDMGNVEHAVMVWKRICQHYPPEYSTLHRRMAYALCDYAAEEAESKQSLTRELSWIHRLFSKRCINPVPVLRLLGFRSTADLVERCLTNPPANLECHTDKENILTLMGNREVRYPLPFAICRQFAVDFVDRGFIKILDSSGTTDYLYQLAGIKERSLLTLISLVYIFRALPGAEELVFAPFDERVRAGRGSRVEGVKNQLVEFGIE